MSDDLPAHDRQRHALAGHDHNVIPFPSPRLLLPVTLVRDPAEASHHAPSAELAALLHSPLGVYVVDTDFVRDEIRVLLDIAPDDLDFTLHTLIRTLARGTIGRVSKRRSAGDTHEPAQSTLR
nr:hypothetical protein [Paraburkholderia phosphatilytica]